MATGELRDRVRERLVRDRARAARGAGGAPRDDFDEVVRLLADRAAEEVAQRRDRLVRALADFDAATIATTHGFCQEVLGGLGVAGDLEPDAELVEDVERPARRGGRRPLRAPLHERRGRAADHARRGAADRARGGRQPGRADRAARRVRRRAPGAARAPGRRACARSSTRASGALSIITYDDLLTRLRDALAGAGGAGAVARLRERYRVVLVDEFQDTDPIQWEILRARVRRRRRDARADRRPETGDLRLPRRRRLRLPGGRRDGAASGATLDVNWRSDQGLIDAYDAMFGGAQLGDPRIVYRQRARAGPGAGRASAGRAAADAGGRSRGPGRSRRPARASRALNVARGAYVARDLAARPRPRLLGARRDGPAGRRRRARPLQPPRRCWSATRWTTAGVPVGDQRRGQRVRHPGRARVAAAAGGARAAGVAGAARARGGADVVPRLDGGAGRRGGRGRVGGGPPPPARAGRRCCGGAGSRR